MKNDKSDFLSLMAIGDAFGMKYEFVEHDIPVSEDNLFYGPHPKFVEYQTGHYTDDTQMALANAELLLEKRPRIERRDFVQAWLHAFRRDPRVGYSKFMFQLMNENLSPEDFCARIDATKGMTSGAAMRAAPFGLLADLETVKKITCEQATPTHDTVAGRTSALFVALSTHFLHHGGKIQFLETFLDHHLGNNWCSEQNGLTDDSGNGLKICSQALNAIKNERSVSRILLAGVSQARHSDTDTVCAIAMAISSRGHEIDSDLTENLRTGIENGPYGVDYLKQIDIMLTQKFPRSDRYANIKNTLSLFRL